MVNITLQPRFHSPRQSGLALVTVLLIVALATTAAAYMSLGQEVWIRQSQMLIDRAQGEAVRWGALNWAAEILIEDAKDNKTDSEEDDWNKALPPLSVEGGMVTGEIKDAHARFNLNSIVRNGKPSRLDLGIYRRLLENQGLDPDLADALVDWLDPDSTVRPNGAEDLEYLSVAPPLSPYRAANQALQTVDELRLVRGYNGEIITKIRPYVTALPEATTININTAEEAVLQVLLYPLTESAIKDFTKERPYKTAAKAIQRLKKLAPEQEFSITTLGVQSTYFEVRIATQFGRFERGSVALLERKPGSESVKLLWHSQRLIGDSDKANKENEEKQES